jgi:hypothetical protein
MHETRQAASKALERALGRGVATRASPSRGRAAVHSERRPTSRRRSAEQIAGLAEQLYELVCAEPGESMARLAEQTGIRACELHRPMSKLKAEGRVRSVGQRHLTRYFPAVGRRSRDA